MPPPLTPPPTHTHTHTIPCQAFHKTLANAERDAADVFRSNNSSSPESISSKEGDAILNITGNSIEAIRAREDARRRQRERERRRKEKNIVSASTPSPGSSMHAASQGSPGHSSSPPATRKKLDLDMAETSSPQNSASASDCPAFPRDAADSEDDMTSVTSGNSQPRRLDFEPHVQSQSKSKRKGKKRKTIFEDSDDDDEEAKESKIASKSKAALEMMLSTSDSTAASKPSVRETLVAMKKSKLESSAGPSGASSESAAESGPALDIKKNQLIAMREAMKSKSKKASLLSPPKNPYAKKDQPQKCE